MSDKNKEAALSGGCWFNRLLAAVIFLLLAALLVCQLGMYQGRLQPVDSWRGAEYRDGEVAAVTAQTTGLTGTVVWRLTDYSCLEELRLLKNGYEAGRFTSAEVRLRVADGDVLEIDATAYQRPVRLKLQQASSGIDRSYLLRELGLSGERLRLGKIVFE